MVVRSGAARRAYGSAVAGWLGLAVAICVDPMGTCREGISPAVLVGYRSECQVGVAAMASRTGLGEGSRLNAEQLLRDRGMRVTPQRRAVLRCFLDHSGQHWTADEVRERLLPILPELARGTTYKTLNELVRRHILEESATADGSVRFGLRLAPHHHFYCVRCRRWYDVQVTGVDGLLLDPDQRPGRVEDVDVTFRGICRACAEEARQAPL